MAFYSDLFPMVVGTKDPFLETYPTPLHSSPAPLHKARVFWSNDDPQTIQDKIRRIFQDLQLTCTLSGLDQFWAPVTSISGRRLLTTFNQPFSLSSRVDKICKDAEEHRLCCLKYQYSIDVNDLDDVEEEDPTNTIITNGAPASAFLNGIPELLPDLTRKKDPLLSSAWECGLRYSLMLPVFDPSRSGCVGVLECSTNLSELVLRSFRILNIELEKQGLKTYDAREHLPYKTIGGLQDVKYEIDEALKIISQKLPLPFAQVWIAYNYHELEGPRTRRMSWLKLTSKSLDDEYIDAFKEYSYACYRIPIKMKMDEEFAGRKLQKYEPHFTENILSLNYNEPRRLFSFGYDASCFVIYLRSTKTGDLDYVFQVFWSCICENHAIFFESLLLALKGYLPSFNFASGSELGDEIDILDVNNSTESENKYIKIFQASKISLKRGRQSMVKECLTPLKARGKTTPIILSRGQIESQFGQTLEEAAPKLNNVSVSTLKRNCKRLGIKWQGRDHLKGNVKSPYKNQSNTTEEEDQGGVQDLSAAIIRETSLDESTLTIKVEYAGDVRMFTLPIYSATFEVIEKKIGERFKLNPANYKLKYHDDEDNEWILFDCDEDVTLCTKNKRKIRLCLVQRDPSGTYQLT